MTEMPAGAMRRFFAKVDVQSSGCWLWEAATKSNGYGMIWDGKQIENAHRFAWISMVGPIPDGLEIDHVCCNKACVNPSHLEPVTHLENVRRWSRTFTHCPQGHSYSGHNLYVHPKTGYRSCRTCRAERNRQRKRAA